MKFSELLEPGRVLCGADARSKKRAIEVLSDALASGADELSHSAVFASLIGRERLGSTAVGHGVALPHGRFEGLTTSRGAFVRLAQPVDFEADDGEPVDLLFGLLVPSDCSDEHLAALAAVAARFDQSELRRALRGTQDPARAYGILAGGASKRQAAG